MRTQALDNVTVEPISAGELIEPPRDNEDELSLKPASPAASQLREANAGTSPSFKGRIVGGPGYRRLAQHHS